jgi:hypothetical protein
MSRKLATLLAAASLVGAVPAATTAFAAPGTRSAVATAAAHTCSSGYKHAVIGGQHKCLRRGQYCARRYDSQYHRYGYHCHRADRNGDYHLE